MKVAVWSMSDDACAEYRLNLPAKTLAAQGHDVFIDANGAFIQWNLPLAEGGQPSEHHQIVTVSQYDADVVVMQRPANRSHVDLIPHLKKQGIRVIIDIDDRYDQIHRGNMAFEHFDPNTNKMMNYKFVYEACKIADAVTATTPDLVNTYGFGHGYLIPNYIPERYFDIRLEKIPNSIGWAGAMVTHPTDLQTVGSAVANVVRDTQAHFRVIGPGEGVQDALGLSEAPEATDWVSRETYFEEVSRLEVGIVPLADSVFNKSKSALKMLEYAALGVAPVGSPTPDNTRVNKLGIGRLAATPQKWQKTLRSLVNNEAYRKELAEQSLDAVKSQTYEKNAYKWLEVWTDK